MSNESAPPKQVVWNVPNQITAARILLSVAVFVLLPLQFYLAAMIIFLIAAGTDWVDGYWARKFNQVTQLGRIMDPFADKIIICGTVILLAVAMHDIPWGMRGWMAVIVMGREMLVTVLRGFIEQHGGDFSARMSGKMKMVFQCAAVTACFLVLVFSGSERDLPKIPDWLKMTTTITIWLAVLSTIYSGVGYIFAASRMIRGMDPA